MSMTRDDVDLSDLEFWAKPPAEREEAFRILREEDPLPFYEEPDYAALGMPIPQGPGYYVITKHADILEVSRNPEVYCSGQGATQVPDMPAEFLEFFGSMINMDDPRHARLRRIVSAGFTPRMLKQVEDSVQQTAKEIVDEVIDRGEVDFVTDVAAKLPLRIICDLMGIDRSHEEMVFTKSNIILSNGDSECVPEGDDVATALLMAGQELAMLMADLGEQRRANPTDDLTSALVSANIDDEQLTDQELASFFILLVVAGNETTRNAISHGLEQLTKHPDQYAAWQADFEAMAPTAVEEIVRWASPVMYMRRTATRDVELRGKQLHEGDKVLLYYSSANRDADAFDEPDRFDLTRDPNPHVGFGGPGPHFCLGAHLARREITVMFRELFKRIPDLRATGEASRLTSPFINGIKHLPATFTPGGA